MKKTILIMALAIVAIVVAGVFLWPKGATAPVPPPQVSGPENATYLIEGRPMALAGGSLEVETAPGSASKMKVYIFDTPAVGDLNGDGVPDAAVLLAVDSGGSGTFYYAAAAININGVYKGTNAIFLGDRIAPQTVEIKNGEAIFNYAERKTGEPMTAQPSLGVSKYFTVSGGVLVAK